MKNQLLMMNYILLIFTIFALVSCHQRSDDRSGEVSVRIVLQASLEERREELQRDVNNARENIRDFSEKYGWEEMTREEFMDSVMIFDTKDLFDKTLLTLAEVDTSINLPETYCGALEKRTLIAMSPDYYSAVYPEGIEDKSYEKLLTHEIAHRLHVRVLQGDEEAMGPVWFYEGFAIYAANQFSGADTILSKEEMIELMKNPDRGSYLKYNFIFRYFLQRISLKELIAKAKNEDFNDGLILLMD